MGFPGGSDSKESACNVEDLGLILGWEDPLEEGLATHSSILAWRIPMDRGVWWSTVHGVAKNLLSTGKTQCIHVDPHLPVRPILPFPTCVHSPVLCVCLYSCPANMSIRTIFLDATYMH